MTGIITDGPLFNVTELAHIKERLANLTPGHWRLNIIGEIVTYKQTEFEQTAFEDDRPDKNSDKYEPPIYGLAEGGLMAFYQHSDIQFLLDCRNVYIPWLIGRVTELETELAAARQSVFELGQAVIDCEMNKGE